tara:strand:- start:19205 stop:20215 length:1011 start_codon:yes stop_codon:yes gene_type:complete
MIEAQPLTLTVDLPGRTVAYRLAEVRPQVDGILQQRLFEEGAEVTAGQQLYQIDDDKYRANYGRAQAYLHNTAVQLKRYRDLLPTGAVSKQLYDNAEADWKLAKAEAELARIDLDHTQVMAPVTGRIGRSEVSEGALVNQGQLTPLATIQQIDPIYVDINQPAVELLRLREAVDARQLDGEASADVELVMENGRIFEHTGTLRFSEVSVDKSTGSVTLRAIVPNPDNKLLPGMFVHARLKQGRKDKAILVPQQAVQRDATGQPSVWVINEVNTVNRRSIKTDRTVGNMWLVREGLQSGESVITEGLQQLRHGMTVEPVPASNVHPLLDFKVAGLGN